MAQQAVRKQASEAGPAPVKRRSPRVTGPIKREGAWDYSRWRITINDPDGFMDFMRNYPNPQEGVTLFLYRLNPPIDHSLIGIKESNIQKGGIADLNLFSFEAVADKFGRGRYNIRVSDSNRPNGQQEVVKTCQYRITECEKPPIYDVRTLKLGDPEAVEEVNRQLALGVLIRDANGQPRLRTAADTAAPPQPLYAAPPAGAGDIVSKELLSQVLIAALGRASASPHESVRDTIEVAKLLHPPPQVDVETIVERVITRMGGAAGKNGAGPREDPFQTYERIDGFLTKYGVKTVTGIVEAANAPTDGGASGARSWLPHLPGVFSEFRLLLPELVAGIKELRQERANGAGGQQPVQQQQRQVQQLTMEQRVEQIVRTGFQKMNEGVRGFDYAAYICGFVPGGLEVYQFLEPQGTAGLIAVAAMNPAARGLVNDPQIRPQLVAFLDDFFSFDPFPSESSEETTETPGAAA